MTTAYGKVTLERLTSQVEVVLATDERFSCDWELLQGEAAASAHMTCECSQCESAVHLPHALPQT